MADNGERFPVNTDYARTPRDSSLLPQYPGMHPGYNDLLDRIMKSLAMSGKDRSVDTRSMVRDMSALREILADQQSRDREGTLDPNELGRQLRGTWLERMMLRQQASSADQPSQSRQQALQDIQARENTFLDRDIIQEQLDNQLQRVSGPDPAVTERFLAGRSPLNQSPPPDAAPMTDPSAGPPISPVQGPPAPTPDFPPPAERPALGGIGFDPSVYMKKLMEIVNSVPANPGAPPSAPLPPEQLQEMSGREGPIPSGARAGKPLDEFLQYLLEDRPLNAGPPPGPTQGLPGDVLEGTPEIPPANTSVSTVQEQSVQHPKPTLDFLARLLGNRPELLAMQGKADPSKNDQLGQFMVALELMNEQLGKEGQAPVELGPDQGAKPFGDLIRSEGYSPERVSNTLNKRTGENQSFLDALPAPVRDLIRPDAAGAITENPKGRLNQWVQELLGKGGSVSPDDPQSLANLGALRTKQANVLLDAGPPGENRSLLQGLSPEEAALGSQAGGMPELATMPGSPLDRPKEDIGSFYDLIRQGLQGIKGQGLDPGVMGPWMGLPPDQRAELEAREQTLGPAATSAPSPPGKMPVGEIASQGRDIFQALLGSLPSEEGGGQPMPDQTPQPTMDFPGELGSIMKQRGIGWMNPGGSTPGPLEGQINREEDLPGGPPSEFGPDNLEGSQAGKLLSLDEGGNIRLGGPGGMVLSGSMLQQILEQIGGQGGAAESFFGGLGKIGKALPWSPEASGQMQSMPVPDAPRSPGDTSGGLDFLQALLGAGPGSQGMRSPSTPSLPGGFRMPELPFGPGPSGFRPPQLPFGLPLPGMRPSPLPMPAPSGGVR